MSIKIGHSSIDENGRASGGKAGDSTKKEVCTRTWYNKPWQYYLECTDINIANIAATYMESICNNDNVGYDQSERLTLYNQLKVHKDVSKLTPCECDCSSLVACCYIMAGLNISPACTTRNLRSALLSTGKFVAYSDTAHLSTDSYAKRGGLFLKEGAHVVMALENGSNTSVSAPSNVTYGMDVSSYQDTIDWTKVKSSNIKFVILRGVIKSGELDPTFERNYAGAINNGIPVIGVYHFSYALNEQTAENDAVNMINKLNGRKMDIFFDAEWNTQRQLGKNKVMSIAKAYINKCKSLGYNCHIYTNLDWYKNVLNVDELKKMGCKLWIARYPLSDNGTVRENLRPNLGEYIWQYSSKGKVNGISGNVDLNIIYGDIQSSPAIPTVPSNPTPADTTTNSFEMLGKINTTSSNLNIRKAPSTSSAKVGSYKKGELVPLLSHTNGWYQTDKGYISDNYVIAATGKVSNCSKLNMRSEARVANGNIITVLSTGDTVLLLDKKTNGWYKVKTADNKVGYISGKYVTIL